MTIAEKLITIADNTPLVAEVVNSTKVTDSGTAVRVEPLQDSGAQVKTRLRSKNLFNYSDWVDYCNSGIGSRAIGDDIYLEQECFSYGNWHDSTAPMFENITFKENTRYTFSLDVAFSYKENESYSMPVFAVYYTDGTETNFSRTLYSNAFTAMTFTSAKNKTIANISTPQFGNVATIYVKKTMQIEEGTIATAFTPYIDDFEDIEVQAFGKNLFDINSPQYSGAGATGAVVNDELVITAKFSNTYMSANYIIPNGDQLVGKTLTVSGEWEESGANVGALRLGWTKIGNINLMDTSIGATNVSGTPFSKTIGAKPSTADKLCLWIYGNYDGTGAIGATVTYRNIQVELANPATEYEPYKAPLTATADAEGNVAGSTSIFPVTTFISTDPSVTVECTYFPTSVEEVYNKAQEIKTALAILKEELL